MIERFSANAGGVENVAWHVAHELHAIGLDVTVLTRETDDGSATLPVQKIKAPRFWQPLRVWAFDRGLARATATGEFDIVHSFARTAHQDLYRAGGGSHADYLARMHSPLGRFARQFSPRHRILLHMERRVWADPQQRVQCSSRLVANALTSRCGVHPDRILLLPNGVDLARYAAPDARELGRALRQRETASSKDEFVWLFAGSGWRRKGLAEVLLALAERRLAKHALWVAGRDATRAWQREAEALGIASRVRFLGPRSDLEILFHAVDAMVLPTLYDAFANVTLEAAAAGLPSITSRANGAAEWLGDGVRIVDPEHDTQALANAMVDFENPDKRARVSAAAFAHAAGLDWTSHAKALRAEYERLFLRRPKAAAS